MFKRASSNHSLWPTKARPNKTKQSVLAIGAFCIGAVAAISAHNVLTDLSMPSQELAQASSPAAVPIYAAPTPTPAMMESANIMNARMAAAKMLSESATAAVPSSATDGRGWEDERANYRVNEIAINWNAALIYATAAFVEPPPAK